MPRLADEPTPTEELQLPRFPGDATLHVPPGEAGLRDALQRLEALEEAIRLHEQATSHPAVPRRPGDHDLYRRLREDEQRPGSNGSG
jgi:hypothetical protein